ncbi:D-aspartate oxidase-like [Haliotis rubra]|uniref:D-aspartate oxidase-like n=1 Tax=Haliotis rubra TaxID=36100 RepID=UPI001EE5A7CA|nr:D-aspartate oxidase-like [Haliotis rubra]
MPNAGNRVAIYRYTRGGAVQQRKVSSFSQLEGEYDVVVNCAGLGAKALTGDEKLQPMRGQMLRVSAPWVKHFLHSSNSFYFIHNVDNVGIGGFKTVGDYSTSVRHDTSKDIWEKLHKAMASTQAHSLLNVDLIFKVVHNYGHGTTGISLSWGTAVHAAELVKEMFAHTSRL